MTPSFDELMKIKTWPFEEAKKLLKRINNTCPDKGYVLFETGYGPSGLPHIGTFGEVARTSMVRWAFSQLSDIPTKLFCFSDDMDGLRKVPDNVPEQEMLTQHLGQSLTSVPDPFGCCDSFGEHNNKKLQAFLDSFGFAYEFKSSTQCYRSGLFDETLLLMLQRHQKVLDAVLPTLGGERQKTYSPFLPISPTTGHVLQVPVEEILLDQGSIAYTDEDGTRREQKVTGGACKLQWKPDWAMRWTALGVDYEMSGKDLDESVRLASKIAKILGGRPPATYIYELFLDHEGRKISKSKGNGLTIDEWLRYAPHESLALYMYQAPRKAKRLHFDVIPKNVDEYLTHVQKFAGLPADKQLQSPALYVHRGAPKPLEVPVPFAMLLNLASVCNADEASVLWGFVSRYAPGTTAEANPFLAKLVEHAVAYYQDYVKPHKAYRAPSDSEEAALKALLQGLEALPEPSPAEEMQNLVYAIGKDHGFENLRLWFKALYEILLGSPQGPRMGSFFELYGMAESKQLIRRVLDEGCLS